jgi:sugar phosphate isomerase/epimerase
VIRRHTERCFIRAVDLAGALGADALILPAGFNPLLPAASVEGWRDLSVETWESVGAAAARKGVEVLIKNVFDDTPGILQALLDALEGLPFGACLDVGHIQVYSTVPVAEWIRSFGARRKEVHLHDNLGASDDHMALGEGIIDFPPIFRHLLREDPIPALTFDMQLEDAAKSLSYVARHDLLGLQLNLL